MNDREQIKSFQNWLGKIFIRFIISWPLVLFIACFNDSGNTSVELFCELMIFAPIIIGFIYILVRIFLYFTKD